jgi:hypothetical protein
MKSFFQFLTETESKAKEQARKLGLKSDGHGGWLDRSGEFVAKTEGDKLRFFNKGQRPGRDPDQTPGRPSHLPVNAKKQAQGPVQQMLKRRKDDDLAGAPLEKKPEEEPKKGEGETLTTAFGRFNPPTVGHEKLLGAARKAAAGGQVKIYPSRSQDAKKNPLDPDMKISYMKKMFPDYEEEIVNDAEMKTIFDVLKTADADGFKNVNIVVGADRQAEFENLATKYNGELYDFDQIRVISAGVRDSDAEGVEGMSASKLRKAVQDDDFDTFRRGTPKGLKDADAQAVFDAVRTGMGGKKKKVKESYELWEIAPKEDQKGLRENYVQGLIYKIGDIVESLNTGLIGEIIRRGTNHLICVTKEDYMFKSWIKDVMEAVKPAAKTGIYGVPASQRGVGTQSYTNYAKSMVPGQTGSWGRQFINKYKKKK